MPNKKQVDKVGRHSPRWTDMAHVVKVVFSDGEFEELRRQAGLVPMSRWIRVKVCGAAGPTPKIPKKAAVGTEVTPEMVTAESRPLLRDAVEKFNASYFGYPLPPACQIEKVEEAVQAEYVEHPSHPKPKKSKTCAHGTEQGYNCWQCGGLARVEK